MCIEVNGEYVRNILPKRDPMGHKGTFGKVHVVGGSIGYTGAPVLAAKAALRTGSGLVSLSVPRAIYDITAVKCDEAMPFPMPCDEEGRLAEEAFWPVCQKLKDKDACLIGPGLGGGRGVETVVLGLLETADMPVVLDADGLNAISAHMDRLNDRCGRSTILTPHEGEFARLGGDILHEGRIAAAVGMAINYRCIVVLKGHRTVTALPNGKHFINTTGNSGMAKGGSGDILAGMILSLLGQGLSPEDAAVAAVWLHGRAGDLAAEDKGEYGMLPLDLLEQIPYAIKEVTV